MSTQTLFDRSSSPNASSGRRTRFFAVLLTVLILQIFTPLLSAAGNEAQSTGTDVFSPYADPLQPFQLLWGDTHVHTSYSTDAALLGNSLGPEQAYRFARGETVTSSTGLRVGLKHPLDFLVIADHSENLGLAPMMVESNPELLSSSFGKKLNGYFRAGDLLKSMVFYDEQVGKSIDPIPLSESTKSAMWQRMTAAAEKYNSPGTFTALIAYEWTGTPGGSNLHRNVVYRDGKERADSILPFTAFDSTDPEALWDWMSRYEDVSGGKVLAIPHNGNLSNGMMFDDSSLSGEPLNTNYARRRMRWEPVYEVTQIKGDGETHPLLSSDDEFADFETWDTGSYTAAKKPGMIAREYAREALKRGLLYQQSLGVNPFKFGMVGGTDSHTSLATSEEDNFFGKAPPFEPSAQDTRFFENIIGHYPDPDGVDYAMPHARVSASGLTAVWATTNTREAIWDALKRREVYATTGTRIRVRLFAGYGFCLEDLTRSDFASYGYANGVPMGGELQGAGENESPAFIIQAERAPEGANLDRIQIIKGWIDSSGESQERIYDVAVSGHRSIDKKGRARTPIGNTVDEKSLIYSNAIGSARLEAFWRDPAFAREQGAVYYARVLEIPTPRWTSYDAGRFGVELPPNVPLTIQERAYTSPVWYWPTT